MLRLNFTGSSLLGEPSALIVCAITGMSAVIFGTLPILMGLFSEQAQLNWLELGWLGAVIQLGSLGGTVIAYRIIATGKLRVGLIRAASCAALSSFFTAMVHGFLWLALLQGLTGLAVGCVFGLGISLVSRTTDPESAFSLMSGVQVASASAYAVLLPILHMHAGLRITIASVGLWFVGIVWLASNLPAGCLRSALAIPAKSTHPRLPSMSMTIGMVSALLSLFVFEIGVAAFWVFSERIGVVAGLGSAQIGAAIGIGGLGGLPASGVGSLVGGRVRPLRMLLLATLAVCGGELLVLRNGAFGGYLAGQFIFNFGWILGISYYMGLIADHDPEGRIIRFIPPAVILAAGIGPAFVGVLAQDSSIASVGISCSFAGAALLFAVLMAKLLSPLRVASRGGTDLSKKTVGVPLSK